MWKWQNEGTYVGYGGDETPIDTPTRASSRWIKYGFFIDMNSRQGGYDVYVDYATNFSEKPSEVNEILSSVEKFAKGYRTRTEAEKAVQMIKKTIEYKFDKMGLTELKFKSIERNFAKRFNASMRYQQRKGEKEEEKYMSGWKMEKNVTEIPGSPRDEGFEIHSRKSGSQWLIRVKDNEAGDTRMFTVNSVSEKNAKIESLTRKLMKSVL